MFIKDRHSCVLILVLFLVSLFICANGAHFVLIHGASHGAWCWYKVATLLKSAGHNVTALDMAASGINPKQPQEIQTILEHYEPLMTFLGSLPPKEKVILVGHSFGGIAISLAMERFPEKISIAVFATAFVVSGNLTYPAVIEEQRRRVGTPSQLFISQGPNKPAILTSAGVKFLASRMYQLSSPEDLTLAFSLVRPEPVYRNDETLLKETRVTKDRNGRVPKVYIVSERDNLIKENFQRWIIERTGPYVEVKVIKGSDHMVMFSEPKMLSSHLLEIANKY